MIPSGHVCVVLLKACSSLVRETLDWTGAPGTTYVNVHMSILGKRNMQTVEYREWGQEYEELRLYISGTYPADFGVILRIGEATMKNRLAI